MKASDDVNADETKRWNTSIGAAWVEHQEFLDASMAGVLELLMDVVNLQPGEHVLDIGCGCGATCFAAHRHVGETGKIIGADFSEPMLEHAAKLASAMGAKGVEFKKCDAQVHDFLPHSFDVVMSRFGVMFFADPQAAFRNMAAALKPNGRVCFVAWAGLEKNPWFALPRQVASRRFELPTVGDQNAPGPMAFHDRRRVEDILKDAGLQNVQSYETSCALTPPGGAREFATFMKHFGSLAQTIRELGGSDDDVDAYVADLKAELSCYETKGRVRLPAALNIFQACVPSS